MTGDSQDRRRRETNSAADDRPRVPFARLDDQTWTMLTNSPKQRAGAWPAHGVMLGVTAYSRPAPQGPAPRTVAAGCGRYFSTPDTTPTAANARSNHDPTRPAGLGNQVRALLAAPTTVAAEHPGIATIKPGQQEPLSAQVIALMPTPNTGDGTRTGQDPAQRVAGGHQVNLVDAVTGISADSNVRLLPRPTVQNHKGANQRGALTLPSAVHLLPTPTAGDARSSAIQTVQQPSRPIPAGAVTLTDAARLLPTPRVAQHPSRSGTRSGELLLPGVVQTLALAPGDGPADAATTRSKDSEARR